MSAVYIGASRGVAAVLQMAVLIAVAKLGGAMDAFTFGSALATASLAAVAFDCGFGAYAMTRMDRHAAAVQTVVRAWIKPTRLAWTVVCVLGTLAFVRVTQGSDYRLQVAVAGLSIALAMQAMVRGMMIGRGRVQLEAGSSLGSAVASSASALAVYGQWASVPGTLLSMGGVVFLGEAARLLMLGRHGPVVSPTLADTRPFAMHQVAAAVQARGDIILLQAFGAPAAGSAAYLMFSRVHYASPLPLEALNAAYAARFRSAPNDRDAMVQRWFALSRLLVMVIGVAFVPTAVTVCLLADISVPMTGWEMALFAGALAARLMSYPLSMHSQLIGLQKQVMRISISALGVNLAILCMLAWQASIWVAVVAGFLSEMLLLVRNLNLRKQPVYAALGLVAAVAAVAFAEAALLFQIIAV